MWCWFHRASGSEHRGEVWQTGAAQFHQQKPQNKQRNWDQCDIYWDSDMICDPWILSPGHPDSYIPPWQELIYSLHQPNAHVRSSAGDITTPTVDLGFTAWTLQTKSRKGAFSKWLRHPAPRASRRCALALLKSCRTMVPAHQSFHPSCDKLCPDGNKWPWIHYEAHDYRGNSHWEATVRWMRNTRLVCRLHW